METEQKPITPTTPTQPDLPGFSNQALDLTPEQRARVVEYALKNNVSDKEAYKNIRQQDLEDAKQDRDTFHAP